MAEQRQPAALTAAPVVVGGGSASSTSAVAPEAAAAAAQGVTAEGQEMARALLWLVDECIAYRPLPSPFPLPPPDRPPSPSPAAPLMGLKLRVGRSGVAVELQEEARAGVLCMEGEACHVLRNAALPQPSPLEALKQEGLALRSPMYCDTRRDVVNSPGFDCFGQPLMSAAGDKNTEVVTCPHCGQKTGATRFGAPAPPPRILC